jgi:hypothetical protein
MLNDVSHVHGVVTQGEPAHWYPIHNYVTSYQVLYRQDGDEWQTATGQDGSVTVRYTLHYGV